MICEWLASNKLSLNARKTKFMVFHTVQRKIRYPILTINNTVIERVKQFNFLGIILHYTLKWQKHIDHVSKKVSKADGVMYRLKHVYPEAVLLICGSWCYVPIQTCIPRSSVVNSISVYNICSFQLWHLSMGLKD